MPTLAKAIDEIKAINGEMICKAFKEGAHDAKIAVQDFLTIHFDYDITKTTDSNHKRIVKQIFNHDIECTSEDAKNALFTEITVGNTHLVKRLIEKGRDFNIKYNNQSPLSAAIEGKHMRLAFKLVKLGIAPTPEEKIQMLEYLVTQKSFKPEHLSRIISTDNINHPVNSANETLLHVALKTPGNQKLVQFLIENGADVHSEDTAGNTPLHVALKTPANDASIKLLIKKGADVNKTNQMGMAPLNIATQFDLSSGLLNLVSSSFDYVTLLIETGQAKLKTSTPLLSFAFIRDHQNIATYLLNKGADINTQDENRMTLLHHAIGAQNQEVVEYLLKKGVDVNLANNDGQTPLQLAIVNSQPEIALKLVEKAAAIDSLSPLQKVDLLKTAIKMGKTTAADLIVQSINLNEPDKKGNTLLHEAAQTSGNEKLIQFLIKKGAAVNQKNNDGMTPLNYAALYSSLDSIKLLVENGNANLNTSFPLLSFELIRRHQDAATYLLGKGADINGQDKDGNTLLHLAAKNRNSDKELKFLIEKGANVNAANAAGETPLEIAIINQNAAHARLLLTKTANPNPSGRDLLHKAIETQYIHGIAALLENKGDLHAANAEGKTPIDVTIKLESSTIIDYLVGNYSHEIKKSTSCIVTALVAGKEDLAQQFLKLGATLDKQSAFFSLENALITNKMDTAHLLIQYGVNINTPIGETTLLHKAIEDNNVETTKNLIQLGANVALQDGEGNTPLHLAAKSGNKDLLSAVISKENLNLTNKKGQTALKIAMQSKDHAFKNFAITQTRLMTA